MKYRTDFVTNSSSSSFIVAFENKETAVLSLSEKAQYNDVMFVVLNDIIRAETVPMTEIIELATTMYRGEAYWKLSCETYGEYRSFCDYLKKKHGISQMHEVFQHPEYIATEKEFVDNKTKELMEKLKDKEFVVLLEYGDHTLDGAELEHHVMPELEYTVAVFSHH